MDAAVGTGQQQDPVEDGDENPIAPVGQALVDELVDRICERFALSRNDLAKPGFKFVLPGMKVGLELDQLWAVVWIISSKPHRNIATALLADGMGLGKTATALGVAALHHTLMTRRQHVLEYPEQHLRPRGQDEYAECPSGSYTSGMQCPCLFNGWTAQFAKFIDPNAPAPLQLVDLRSSPIREKVELMATCEFVNPKKLRAAAGPDDDPYVGRARLSPEARPIQVPRPDAQHHGPQGNRPVAVVPGAASAEGSARCIRPRTRACRCRRGTSHQGQGHRVLDRRPALARTVHRSHISPRPAWHSVAARAQRRRAYR